MTGNQNGLKKSKVYSFGALFGANGSFRHHIMDYEDLVPMGYGNGRKLNFSGSGVGWTEGRRGQCYATRGRG